MDTDLDTLATALYVTCDDLLVIRPEHAPYRPESGFEPAITDAELITLAVMSALLGYTSERRSNRSMTPSKANSTSNTTKAAPSPGFAPASDNASWP